MRKSSTVLFACCAAFACGVSALGQTAPAGGAQIEGKVLDYLQRPLREATVSLQVRPSSPKDKPKPFNTWVRTDSTGTFRFASVPDGMYLVCAQLPESGLLDSCTWGTQTANVIVTGARPVSMPPIVLRKGHALRIRVNDGRGLLLDKKLKTKAKKDDPEFPFGVWTPGGTFVPMAKKYEDPRGEEYEILVPYETALKIDTKSKNWKLTDDKGKDLDTRHALQQSMTVKRGKEPPMFYLEIQGEQGK